MSKVKSMGGVKERRPNAAASRAVVRVPSRLPVVPGDEVSVIPTAKIRYRHNQPAATFLGPFQDYDLYHQHGHLVARFSDGPSAAPLYGLPAKFA